MIRKNIDNDWLFTDGFTSGIVIDGLFQRPGKPVDLPHDFMIETETYPDAAGGSSSGYYGGGIGTYTKTIEFSDDYLGKRVLVEFDGSYMNTTVGLNGNNITMHHYGYTPFHADITPYIKLGQPNRLHVTVNNSAQPNSRWYTGSGIYRHVDLLCAPEIHIAPWGIFAHTSHMVNGTAFVTVETTIENHSSKAADLWINIKISKGSDGSLGGTGKIIVHIPADDKAVGKVLIPVPNADMWDIDSPDLYQITAELTDQDIILDCDTTIFGIRTISVDTINGFMLNGRTVKLKGGCIHHDNGILGASSFRDSEYRKMKLHKEHGYNAIRCAHNPPSRDMLDACDRLGLLVINEAFDVWTMAKSPCDYSLYFEADWKKDMELFMLRDRNHPSIIIWSTGNEIPERSKLSNGIEWSAKLASWVRTLDPTRPVINAECCFFNGLDDYDMEQSMGEMIVQLQETGSIQNFDTEYTNQIWGGHTEAFFAPLDIAGYNYLEHRYEMDGKAYPSRIICCTESRALEAARYWDAVERLPYVIGDFTWTSYDYIGEAGIGKAEYVDADESKDPMSILMYKSDFPYRLSNDADFDLCGFTRPQLAYRKIVWGSDLTFIASHNPKNWGKKELISKWGWPECDNSWSWDGYGGRPVQVDIYSAADEVELILNGESLGRKPAGKSSNFTATFDITYEPGTLEAISYKDGSRVSSDLIKTTGKPAAIRISTESSEIYAGCQSLCFAVVEVIDVDGNRVPTAEIKTCASVDGCATLAAYGSSNPKATENYTKGEFTTYKGRLLAIVRSGNTPGKATLTIDADGLPSASADIFVKNSQ